MTNDTVAPNNADVPRVFETDPAAALLISTMGDDFDYESLAPGQFEAMVEELREELDKPDDGEDLDAGSDDEGLGPCT